MKDRWDTRFIFYLCLHNNGFIPWDREPKRIFYFSLSVSLWTQECSHRSFNIFNMLKPFRVLVLLDGQIILLLKLTSRTFQKSVEILALIYVFFWLERDFLDSWNSSKSGVTCFSRNLWFLLLTVVLKDHNTGAGSIHCYMTILSVGTANIN